MPNKSLQRTSGRFPKCDGNERWLIRLTRSHVRGVGTRESEFPKDWSDERIIHHVSDIADNKSIPTRIDNRGTPYKEAIRDGVKIRVTYFPKGHPREGKFSSAYPPDLPKNP